MEKLKTFKNLTTDLDKSSIVCKMAKIKSLKYSIVQEFLMGSQRIN